ncbi:hypothetical protein DAMA08_046300 [Martiniozyma asiatica (nom. inval.)]|nr:hypothetical protein DAMA08_046300 [Martiniozyma asiatica]
MDEFELIPNLVADEEEPLVFTRERARLMDAETNGTVQMAETDPSKRVPVTILSGYLGSGKSTLLERIAKRGDRKLAVILNEFGDTADIEKTLSVRENGSDVEEWLDLGNGCLCCTVKDNGVAAIERLVKKKSGFDHIILETTGLADPGPIATMFWLDDALASNVFIDGVVTVLDAENIEKCLDDVEGVHHHGDKQEEEDGSATIAHVQIALADAIVLNKIDRLQGDDTRLARVVRRIRAINGNSPIHQTSYGDIDLDKILGLHAYEAQDVNRLIQSGVVNTEATLHDHHMGSVTLNFGKLHSEQEFARVEEFLRRVLWKEEYLDGEGKASEVNLPTAMEIHRTKGLVFVGKDQYRVVQGVRSTYEVLCGVQPIAEVELTNCRLVFIGKHLDKEALCRAFETMAGVAPEC